MLDPHPHAQLCFVIQQYGQVIITEPKRCKGMLSDLAPHHRLEINLLIAALEQKVTQELLKPTALIPVAMQLDRLAQRLHDTVGIKEDFAYWAVESWALALNVIQQPIPKVAVTPPPAQNKTPTDAWLDELIAWAAANDIREYEFSRDKQAILALTRLNLWRKKLTELPESIGKLTNLTELKLSDNPHDYPQLPTIWYCKSVELTNQ